MKAFTYLFLVMIVSLLIITSCDEKSPTNPSTVSDVTINPSTVFIAKGYPYQFQAVVNGTGNPSQNVTWTVSSGSGNSLTQISTSGLLIIAINETAPVLIVTATSVADPSKNQNATVNVLDVPPVVSNVFITPEIVSAYKGFTQQFHAEVEEDIIPSQGVTWSVVGGINTTNISSNGLLTIAENETATFLSVKATAVSDQTKYGLAMVYIVAVSGVEVSPDNVYVGKGDTATFTAWVYGSPVPDADEPDPPQDVTWSVSGGVSGTSIILIEGNPEWGGPSYALLTVALNEVATTLTVRAISTTDPTKSGVATVHVMTPAVESVVVSPNNCSIFYGQSRDFRAEVNGLYASNTVTWSIIGGSSGTNIELFSGMDFWESWEVARLTVANSETATTLTVKATSTVDTSKSGEATISLSPLVVGPSGGYIFYDKGYYSDGWRYLEAAPVSSEFRATWGLFYIPCPNTSTDIGTGKANTATIINQLNENGESSQAAQLCDELSINGFDDWFLPSRDELQEMYYQLCVGNNIGGFQTNSMSHYWSSSTYGESYMGTHSVNFYTHLGGIEMGYAVSRFDELNVRAVRSF